MPEVTEAALGAEITGDPALGDRPRRSLPPAMEAEIEQRRQKNALMAAIAGMSWGKNMSVPMRRAYADYCARYDVDPITEMDNLGGNVYVNAEWYLRKLGELRVRGIIKDFRLEHIHADPRLRQAMEDQSLPDELRKRATTKWFDMLMKRIEHNAPDTAKAVCVCTIELHNGGTSVQGCKWAGGGTSIMQPRHGGGSQPNPVTEANPTLSVESQSVRRALRQLLSHISGKEISALQLPSNVESMDDEIDTLATAAERSAEVRKEAREESVRASADVGNVGTKALAEGSYADEGARMQAEIRNMIDRRTAEAVPIVHTGTPPKAMDAFLAFAASEDPYGLDARDSNATRAIDETPAEPTPGDLQDNRDTRTSGEFVDGVELNGDGVKPNPGPASPDLFGTSTSVEPTSLDTVECEMCGRMIRKGHPEDHEKTCDGYRQS